MAEAERAFRFFIIKKLAGDLSFSAEDKCFRLSLRTITPLLRGEILAEGQRLGYPDAYTERVLAETVAGLETSMASARRTVPYVEPNTLAGEKVILTGKEQGVGIEIIELLAIGRNDFFVLASSRSSLRRGDLLRPYDDKPWAPSFPVCFKVYRKGRRFPNRDLLFRTFTLREITVESPSEALRVVDSISITPSAQVVGDSDLSFGTNPMALLMGYREMPIVANVCDPAKSAFSFTSVPGVPQKPCAARETAFDLPPDVKNRTVSITTTTPGRFELCADGAIKISEKAIGLTS